jgi:fibronectin type 3 domain-containing protein
MKTILNIFSSITIVILLIPAKVLPQQFNKSVVNHTSIKLIARATSDSVVLRWAPTTPGGWLIANSVGYRVERFMMEEGKELTSKDYKPITREPIKPMQLEAWMKYAGANNKFSAIAAQALYGKSFVPDPLKSDSLINLRNAADELTNRYSYALLAADNDLITANALGLRFVDREVIPNSRYIYRVMLVETTKEMAFDTAYIMVETQPAKALASPVGFSYRSGDGSIQLLWPNTPNSEYIGYYLYRSDDGGKTFFAKNQVPIVYAQSDNQVATDNILYIDTATVNYKVYSYRLVGVTPFGELSAPAMIKAFSRDLTPPAAPILKKPTQVASGKIKLSWDYKSQPADLKGFVISQSDNANTGYKFITANPLPKNVKEYVVDLGSDFEAYFMVASVDTAGNLGFSPPILASLTETPAPKTPQAVKGEIDKSGRVTLTWKPVNSKNIIGYRIYRSNDPSHEFIAVNGQVHPDTVFIDSISLNTLSKNIFYRVAAVNSRYQYSDLSPILQLKRPDFIPPAPAVIDDVSVTEKSVTIQWRCSPSTDVAVQRLYRKTDSEKQWTLIDSLKPGINRYVDLKVIPKTTYYYTLTSVDSSRNVSKMANAVSARPYDSGKRDPVKQLTAKYDKQSKSVTLKWQYPGTPTTSYWFVVYRANGNKDFVELKGLKPDILEFTDTSPLKGTNSYGIVVMTSDGGQSEMVVQKVEVAD